MFKKKLILFFVFINHIAFSQLITKKDTSSLIEINKLLSEVVVTGQINPINQKNAIQNIKIIGAKELKSGLYNNLAEALSQKLNIQLIQDNVLGSGLKMQGLAGQNVKILIDEIPVIGRLNGNIDLSQINLENIERIEIVEGPLSVNYGTDALAGTINIITKKKYALKRSLAFKSYYESIGRYNNSFSVSNNNNNIISIYELERNYFDGWSENDKFNFIPKKTIADTNRAHTWKPKEQISNKIQWIINKEKSRSRYYINHFYEKITNIGYPRGPYFESAFDDYYYTFRRNAGTDLNYKLNNNPLRFLLSYNDYKRIKSAFINDLTTLTPTLLNDLSAQDTSVFKLLTAKTTFSSEGLFDYQIGLDFQKQIAKGKRLINGTQEQTDYAAFCNLKTVMNNYFLFNTGLRLIYNTKYQAPLIPSLSFMYNSKKNKLRISFAKGFRAPTLKELFFDFVDINHNIIGNDKLVAEESKNYQLSYNYIYNTTLDFDLSLFQNKINNKIDLTSNSLQNDVYSYFNIGEFESKGISSNLNFIYKKINLTVGGSYIGIKNNINKENVILNDFLYSSEFIANATINILKASKLNLFFKYTGKVPFYLESIDNSVITSYRDGYQLLNASFNKYLSKYNIDLSLGIKNILNVIEISNYTENTSVHSSTNNNLSIGYGRSYFASIKFKL